MYGNPGNFFAEGNVSLPVVAYIPGHMRSGSISLNLKKWRWMENVFYNMRIKTYD